MVLSRPLAGFIALLALVFIAALGWLAWEGLWRTVAVVALPVIGGMIAWAAALRRRGPARP